MTSAKDTHHTHITETVQKQSDHSNTRPCPPFPCHSDTTLRVMMLTLCLVRGPCLTCRSPCSCSALALSSRCWKGSSRAFSTSAPGNSDAYNSHTESQDRPTTCHPVSDGQERGDTYSGPVSAYLVIVGPRVVLASVRGHLCLLQLGRLYSPTSQRHVSVMPQCPIHIHSGQVLLYR